MTFNYIAVTNTHICNSLHTCSTHKSEVKQREETRTCINLIYNLWDMNTVYVAVLVHS